MKNPRLSRGVLYFIGNCVPIKKKIICPSVARYTCSEMDYSKTVAALRRSRFLVKNPTAELLIGCIFFALFAHGYIFRIL